MVEGAAGEGAGAVVDAVEVAVAVEGRGRVVRRYRLTARDVAMLRWVGRQRMASRAQVAKAHGMSTETARRRVAALLSHGLLVEIRKFVDEPAMLLATRDGLAHAGVDLPAAKLDIRTYAHDVGLAELAIELAKGGARVWTERELRHAHMTVEHDEVPVRAVELARGAGLPAGQHHYPDLVVQEPDGAVRAIELELTPKRPKRLERILRGYRAARAVATVDYYAPAERERARLDALAQKLEMTEKVRTFDWRHPHG